MGEMRELSTFWFVTIGAVKVIAVFTAVMVVVAYMTLAERRVSAFIQDRLGPNRVGPFGLLQPIADGVKNVIKEETMPGTAAKLYFVLGPALAIMPAVVTFAVIPFAAPLPTPVGTVDMVVADVPIGILYVLALSSLAVYGIVLSGWASNNKYAFLGGLRASAQMISYEVALGLSVIAVLLLAGNVTLTEMVWRQQQLGLWFVFPLSLAFIFFLISALAETNRLPFDMPEAESELITGYHTEYSAIKFSMFFIAEYAHVVTASALMATLFFGGWDIPFWHGDDMLRHEGGWIRGFDESGAPIPTTPSVLITLLTLGAFCAKTGFFLLLYIWIRWTLPRFRYDQVMHLGWKVLLPAALGYIMLIAGTMLVLDQLGVAYGMLYGLVLTAVSGVTTLAFLFFVDRDRVISGAHRKQSVRSRRGGAVPGATGRTTAD
jgi:NADH-quinone oxidoreductase subunit H